MVVDDAQQIRTDLRGVGGLLDVASVTSTGLDREAERRLAVERYAWLTTVAQSGLPVPMLVWFRFDGTALTIYSQPDAGRIAHITSRPEVSVHLESDGSGRGVLVVAGTAAVTAENVDPRDDTEFWGKYHVEAELCGLTTAIASCSTRITVTPTTMWTSIPR